MAFTGDPHIFSSDDAGLAEAAQEIHDQHDEFVDVFNEQHNGTFSFATGAIGDHRLPQIGAVLVLDTPQGIGERKRPTSRLVSIGVDNAELLGTRVAVQLKQYLYPKGAKAWVRTSYAAPISSEKMNYCTPSVYQVPGQFLDTFWIDFGSFLGTTTPDAIRRIFAVWYTSPWG